MKKIIIPILFLLCFLSQSIKAQEFNFTVTVNTKQVAGTDQRIYEALPNLTIADLLKFADERIARKSYRYIILGNEKALDMEGLQQLGPVKRLTTEEIFGY